MMEIRKPEPEQLLGYECMFFDFDGVVLESGDIKTEAFIELFAGLGIDEEVKEHHLSNQGISRYEKFQWITENLLKRKYTEEVKEKLGDRFASLVKQKVIAAPFVKGFSEMIEHIRKHDIYCVVASGTPQSELVSIVNERRLNAWFDEVHGSPRKKDEIVKEVWERKPFSPEKCLFFGDASTDFEAAQNVNIDFFARLTDDMSAYWSQVFYKYGQSDFSDLL